MVTTLQSRVPAAAAGSSLLTWLTHRFRYFDAAAWTAQIAAGRVQRNGARANVDDVLRSGDLVAFFPAASSGMASSGTASSGTASSGTAAGAPVAPVCVLFADDDVVAVDKPPHLVVQAGSAFVHNTFAAALAQQFPPGPGLPALEPAHRLDRETSGVLLFARHRGAARDLQQQFAAGGVQKQYVAIVHGVISADTLTIDAPIGPAPGSRVAARRAVVAAGAPGARAAVTELTVERRLPAHTLLRIVPRTGRTHQIRVHLEHAGHPLVGDKLYGQSDERYLAYVQHLKAGGDPAGPPGELPSRRQLLHAASLSLLHPRTHEPLVLQAPLPADFAAFLAGAGQ